MRKILLFVIVFSVLGCDASLIPDTNIEDTSRNRAVVALVEDYRSAIEKKSADDVLVLVGEEYFEDRGTVDGDDDYGIDKLRTELDERFAKTKKIQLTVFVQHVEPGDEGMTHVYYRYLQRALLDLPAGKRWVSHSDVNRLVLKRRGPSEKDGFLIVAGL